ncbi:MAG: hypothetical protein ABI851_15845 [Saprospiraceae bacterium]
MPIKPDETFIGYINGKIGLAEVIEDNGLIELIRIGDKVCIVGNLPNRGVGAQGANRIIISMTEFSENKISLIEKLQKYKNDKDPIKKRIANHSLLTIKS